jgi:hypothetical protein
MGKRAPWDRTVHAEYQDVEIVRYDRQGHWYIEPIGFATLRRQKVNLRAAVEQAIWAINYPGVNGRVYIGLPGGGAFDARFRKLTGIDIRHGQVYGQ